MKSYFELDENDYKTIYSKGGRIERFLFKFNKDNDLSDNLKYGLLHKPLLKQ